MLVYAAIYDQSNIIIPHVTCIIFFNTPSKVGGVVFLHSKCGSQGASHLWRDLRFNATFFHSWHVANVWSAKISFWVERNSLC